MIGLNQDVHERDSTNSRTLRARTLLCIIVLVAVFATGVVGATSTGTHVSWDEFPDSSVNYGDTITISVEGSVTESADIGLDQTDGFTTDRIEDREIGASWSGSEFEITIGDDIEVEPGESFTLQVGIIEGGVSYDDTTIEQTITVSDIDDSVSWTTRPPNEISEDETVTVEAEGSTSSAGEVCLDEAGFGGHEECSSVGIGDFSQSFTVSADVLGLDSGERTELEITAPSGTTTTETIGVEPATYVEWGEEPPEEPDYGETFTVTFEGAVEDEGELAIIEDGLLDRSLAETSVSGDFERTAVVDTTDVDPGDEFEIYGEIEEDGLWRPASDQTDSRTVQVGDVPDHISWTTQPPDQITEDETVTVEAEGSTSSAGEVCLDEAGFGGHEECVSVGIGEFSQSFTVSADDLGLDSGEETELEITAPSGTTTTETIGVEPATYIEWGEEPPEEADYGETFIVTFEGAVEDEGELAIIEDGLLDRSLAETSVSGDFERTAEVETTDVDPGDEFQIYGEIEEDGWWGTTSDQTDSRTITVHDSSEPPSSTTIEPEQSTETAADVPVEFTAEATDSDGELAGIDWYVDGEYEDTNTVAGAEAEDTFSYTFDETGEYVVEADAFDAESEYNDEAASWTVTVSDEEIPAADLNIDVVSINGQEPTDGVFEYGDAEGAVVSMEFEITGPRGDSIEAETYEVDVANDSVSFDETLELHHVGGDRYEIGIDVADQIVATGQTGYLYLNVSSEFGTDVQTIRAPTVFTGDKLAEPVDGWVPSGDSHEVLVDGETYTVMKMTDPDRFVDSWLALKEDGTLVTDEETFRKAAQTAHVAEVEARSGDSRQEGLYRMSDEYDELLVNVDRSESVLYIRDTAAEYIGVAARIKSGGTADVKAELLDEAIDDIARDFLEEVVLGTVGTITNEDGQTITAGLLEDNPISSLDAMITEQSENEIAKAGDAADEAATVLDERDRSEPWTHQEAEKFWEAEQQAVTSGMLYANIRANMLPDADARSQLTDVSVAAADGATGDTADVEEVETMVSLIRDGELDYISDSMSETAELRAMREETKEEFTIEADEVRNAAIDEHGSSATLLDDSTIAENFEATVDVIDEPDGTFVSGDRVNTTVAVTNHGEQTQQFFVGYSTATNVDGEQEFFDNQGETGDFIMLAPGETREKTVSWEVQSSAPVGAEYDVITAVWTNFPEQSDVERLDDERRTDAFSVRQEANVRLGTLNLEESTIATGEYVEIEAIYENHGEEAGSKTSELQVDDELDSTTTIDLDERATESISFVRLFDEPGEYEISVGNRTETVNVVETELDVDAVDISPTDGTAPLTVVATADVNNDAELDVSDSFSLFVDGESVNSTATTVQAGETDTVTVGETLTDPGEYEIGFADETSEVTVEEPAESSFTVNLTATNSPIEAGEKFEAVAQITNEGDGSSEQVVSLLINGTEKDTETVEVDTGEDKIVTLEWDTNESETGEYTLEAASGNSNDSELITVQPAEDEPQPTDPAEPELQTLRIGESGEAATITEGTDKPIEGVVQNVGEEAGFFTIELKIGDEITAEKGVELGGGEEKPVTFEGVTDTLDPRDEAYTITVQSEEQKPTALSGELTVEASDETETPNVTLDAVTGLGSESQPIELAVEIDTAAPESATLEILDDDVVVFETDVTDAFDETQTLEWNTTDQSGALVADGVYTVEVTTGDDDVLKTTTVETDNSPPEVEITNVDPDVATTEDDITVAVNVDKRHSSLIETEIGLRSEFTSYNHTELFDEDALDEHDLDEPIEVTIDVDEVSEAVGDGEFTATATAVDAAGTVGTDSSDTISVDTSPPEVQPRVNNLGEDPATITVEADEDVTIEAIDIQAESDERSEDRSPSRPTETTDEFEIEFNGTPVTDDDTTFTIEIVAADEAGNTDTNELTSSITGYKLEDGEATVAPSGTDSTFELSASNNTADSYRNATVGQTSTAPAGTSVDDDQLTAAFVDVTDIGLDETELENATIRVPLAEIDIEGVDDDELVFFYSPEGDEDYEVLETEIVDDELTADVEGFSQLVPGAVDNQPPVIDETTIDPGTDLGENDGEVTLTVEYSSTISDIDVSATSVDTEVDSERTSVDITREETEVSVDSLQAGETFDVELTVVDEGGNDITTTETLSVDETESEDEDEESSTDDGDAGGGDAAAGGGAIPDEERFDIATTEVTNQDGDSQTIDLTTTITNTGEAADSQTVRLRIDGEAAAQQELELDAGDQTTVEFTDVDVSDLSDGDYTYRLITNEDIESGTLTIEAAASTADSSDEQTDESTTAPDEDQTTDDDTAGFGAGAALVALFVATLVASRQQLRK